MRTANVCKRLRDNRGATILMALLALLVVSMVAATILAAANSTVRQAKADQEFEQNVLSLQSAASLVTEDIKRQTNGFKIVASREVTDTLNSEGRYETTYGEWEVKAEGDSFFSEQLVNAVKQVYYSVGTQPGGYSSASGESTIMATFKNQTSGLDMTTSVKASFEMSHQDAIGDQQSEQNTLVFELQPVEYDNDGMRFQTSALDSQTLFVKFTTEPRTTVPSMDPKDGETRTGTETCTYTWNVDKFSTSQKASR